jgi:hypothetical protein
MEFHFLQRLCQEVVKVYLAAKRFIPHEYTFPMLLQQVLVDSEVSDGVLSL